MPRCVYDLKPYQISETYLCLGSTFAPNFTGLTMLMV